MGVLRLVVAGELAHRLLQVRFFKNDSVALGRLVSGCGRQDKLTTVLGRELSNQRFDFGISVGMSYHDQSMKKGA